MQPQRQREVVEGEDGEDAVLVARREHPAVMLERRARELPFGGLDARPLDAESEGVEPEVALQRDVLSIAVVEVAGVAGRLPARGAGLVLPPPPVAVGVAALDLGAGDRGAEDEAGGKHGRRVHDAILLPPVRGRVGERGVKHNLTRPQIRYKFGPKPLY